MATEKHYVRFLSPGTFVSEETRKPIDSWSIPAAVELANGIEERYGAKPYGFQFTTYLEAEPIPDGRGGTLDVTPKKVAESSMHYLGGRAVRFDEVPDSERILRDNMRCNRHPVVVENTNSYKFTTFFTDSCLIVDADGSILVRGDAPELVEYRRRKIAEWETPQ